MAESMAISLTISQTLYLLHIAHEELLLELDEMDPPDPNYSQLEEFWKGIHPCKWDLIGATVPMLHTAARCALARKGLTHDEPPYNKAVRGLRFGLTPVGRAWVIELIACSALIRVLRKLPFDF